MTKTADSYPVFFVSDRTGITAENLGHALLTQFSDIEFEHHSLPFINSKDKACIATNIINQFAQNSPHRPLVFSTLVDDSFREILARSDAHIVDFFDAFIKPLELELNTQSSHAAGLSHGIRNDPSYLKRMDAVNFALKNDDGTITKEYNNADVILIGVSRSGKTPTCLYLAMQFGLKAANYPLTDSDMGNGSLPKILQPYRDKLFGLLINAERLRAIREMRKQHSEYASLAQCRKETRMMQAVVEHEKLPAIDSSYISIEEIATSIIQLMKIQRPPIY